MERKWHFDMIASKALALKLCETKCGLEIQNEIITQLIILVRNKNLCVVRKLSRKTWACFISS